MRFREAKSRIEALIKTPFFITAKAVCNLSKSAHNWLVRERSKTSRSFSLEEGNFDFVDSLVRGATGAQKLAATITSGRGYGSPSIPVSIAG